jgi:hypothetical protein
MQDGCEEYTPAMSAPLHTGSPPLPHLAAETTAIKHTAMLHSINFAMVVSMAGALLSACTSERSVKNSAARENAKATYTGVIP